MNEFCKQCSAEFLDLDNSDFADMCDPGFTTVVLCEGCGPTQVDSNGVCVSSDCLERQGAKQCECGCTCYMCETKHQKRDPTDWGHTEECTARFRRELERA